MATVKYFVSAKKRKIAPVYVRLSAGRDIDLIVKSGLEVAPGEWSNKTQTLKQRIRTEEDDKLVDKLKGLKSDIEGQVKTHGQEFTRQWLEGVIYQYHHKKDQDARTLNEYIEQYITEVENGKRHTKDGLNIAISTGRSLRGFQRIFNEYQGVYTDKRLEELKEKQKAPRKRITIDFEDVTTDLAHAFKNFLIDEGYKVNTVAKFLKLLKYFMSKSMQDKKHTNLQFKESAFTSNTEDAFNISLTPAEVEAIYKYDLSHDERMRIARDKFIVLCETALRVSDYDKIDVNIRTIKDVQLIDLTQTKTGNRVLIPLTRRMREILRKYDGQLPRIHEVYVNRYIKHVALQAGLTEVLRWEETKYGKRYPKSEQKYKLVTCHTGRRTAATNLYEARVPVKIIMSLTGHRTEAQLMDYIKIKPEELALEAARHEYFTGTPLRVAK